MGFSPAFALFDDNGNLFNDTKYLQFGMFNKVFDKINNNSTETSLPMSLWKDIKALSQQFDYYFWPTYSNFTIDGTLLNDKYSIFGFSIDKWINSTSITWASDADINAMLNKLKLKLNFK